MFLGTFEPKLDEKGRLILPSKFREAFASGVVITRGQERCLYLFTMSEFERLFQALRQAPLNSQQARDYTRLFLSGAQDQIPDKQGRINILPALRQYAALDKELAVVGVGSRVEIWDLEAWRSYLERHEDDFSSLGQEVVPGIF